MPNNNFNNNIPNNNFNNNIPNNLPPQSFTRNDNNYNRPKKKKMKTNNMNMYNNSYMNRTQPRNYNNNMNNPIQRNLNLSVGPGEAIKTFTYSCDGEQPDTVQVSGSFDGWKVKHSLIYNNQRNIWELPIKMKKGKYFYKYIIDGMWKLNPGEQVEKSDNGITNNYFEV